MPLIYHYLNVQVQVSIRVRILFNGNVVLGPTKDADPGTCPTWQNHSRHVALVSQ